MTESEKLLIRAGAIQIPGRRHRVYLLKGKRFALHLGTKPHSMELKRVKKKLREMGLLARPMKHP
jgi:hypothetical protein